MNIQCIVFTVYRNGFPSAHARAADTRFPLFAYEGGIRQDTSRTRQAAKSNLSYLLNARCASARKKGKPEPNGKKHVQYAQKSKRKRKLFFKVLFDFHKNFKTVKKGLNFVDFCYVK